MRVVEAGSVVNLLEYSWVVSRDAVVYVVLPSRYV